MVLMPDTSGGRSEGDRRIVLEPYLMQAEKLAVAQSRLRSEPPSWLPGQVSGQQHYTQSINPRSGDPWAVPALIVPEYDEFVRVR